MAAFFFWESNGRRRERSEEGERENRARKVEEVEFFLSDTYQEVGFAEWVLGKRQNSVFFFWTGFLIIYLSEQ